MPNPMHIFETKPVIFLCVTIVVGFIEAVVLAAFAWITIWYFQVTGMTIDVPMKGAFYVVIIIASIVAVCAGVSQAND